MITALFFGIAGIVVAMFVSFLSVLSWSFPGWFVDSIHVFVDLLVRMEPFLPVVADILLLVVIVVPAHIIRYMLELALWVFSIIPVVGKVVGLPKHQYFTSARSESYLDDSGKEHMRITKTREKSTMRTWV
jgi:hypothetical protein